jgi:hypothetical protein
MLPQIEQNCYVFAARYAHTRNTSAAYHVVRAICANWDRFTPEIQSLLLREAKNEATCNHDDWDKLIALPNRKADR